MKKISYLFYLGFLSLSAQINLDVLYRVEFVFEEKEMKNKYVSPLIEMAKEAEKQMKFTLNYSDGRSKFYKNDQGIKSEGLEIASVFADADNIFYSDFENKVNYTEISQNDMFKKNEFIVKDETVTNWTIVDSVKVIGDLKCNYAFTILNKDNIGTNKDVLVEAWFTPELPVSAGPKGFGSLPGLIIQLKVNKTVFIAERIDKLTKKHTILLPEKGEIITNEKYLSILRERTLKIQSSRRE